MDFSGSKRTRGLICLALALVTAGIYWQVHGFGFVNFDDPDYVSNNSVVKRGLTFDGILWAFTNFHASNWHPLTWISHMLDCQLFGLNPTGPHVVNVLFHIANSILLFLLLQRITGALWRSAIVAGLFALHPLHVESVAWISERKDVLSAFLGMLSLLAYTQYVIKSIALRFFPARPEARGTKPKVWYFSALGLFALSLMAKPMLVTLPFLMLLLDFWPLARVVNSGWQTFFSPRFTRLAFEKLPWFVLVVISSVITFCAQKTGGALVGMEKLSFMGRAANAVTSYFIYIEKTCWPVRLSVFYPLPHEQPAGVLLLAVVFLIGASLFAFATIKRWPFVLVGWLWFLGTLVPVIGLVQVGSQALADRYTYIPLIGIFIAVVWGAAELFGQRTIVRRAGALAVLAVLGCFSILTVSQLQYWQNSLTLFNHALAVTKDNAPANNNLGTALAVSGQKQEAMTHYAEAVRLDPNNPRFRNNLATALARDGQRDAALDQYLTVIRLDPQFAEGYANLGALFLAEHRIPEAFTNLYEAVRLEPRNAELHSNLGNALLMTGHLDEALAQHLEAARLDPFNGTVRLNAGLALLKAGRANEAAIQFAAAVRLNPASADARFELGRQMFLDRRFASALDQLGEAAKLRPNYTAAQFYKSVVLGELGRYDEAVATANQALESAQHAGPTNLVARIQQALNAYQSRQPYRP